MQAEKIRSLKVAVVGGGYGGACAGGVLAALGADVTVFEQARAVREVGAGIGLRPSSMDMFRRWGIFEEIAKVSSASDRFDILDAQGNVIMSDTWPGMDDYAVKTHTHLIHRHDFIVALTSNLPEGVLRTGHRMTRVTDHGDHATVEFADGHSGDYDLVIGADGIKSVVRAQIFSDQQPVFAGEHAYRVVVDASDAPELVTDDNLRMYIGRGTKVYTLPLRHRGQMSFDITALDPDPTWNPANDQAKMLSTVEGFAQPIIDLTAKIDMEQVNVRAVYDIDPVENWHTDSIALLGDSAHAMCHHQGQGANSAILDADALGTALQQADTVPEALAFYQATRKPVTDELQRISRQGWSEDEVNDVFPGQKPRQD